MDTVNTMQKLSVVVADSVASLAKSRQAAQLARPAMAGMEATRPNPVGNEDNSIDADRLRELVQQANDTMAAQNRRLMFSVDDNTGVRMVKVFDMDTDKVIRQFPPEEYVGVVEQIQRMSSEDTKSFMLTEQA